MDNTLAINTIKKNLLSKGFVRWWTKEKKKKESRLVEAFEFLETKKEILSKNSLTVFILVNDILHHLKEYYSGKNPFDRINNIEGVDLSKLSDQELNEKLVIIANWFNIPEVQVRGKVKDVDPSLTYVKLIYKDGMHSYILLVKDKDDKKFILKVNKKHETIYPGTKNHTLEYEYLVMDELKVVRKVIKSQRCIPHMYKFYNKAPSMEGDKLGKNAFLMEYIPGETLSISGEQSISFFNNLYKIVNQIFEAGFLPPSDFHASNILVDENNNPVLIDFMHSVKLSNDPKIAEGQKDFFMKILKNIEQRHSYN